MSQISERSWKLALSSILEELSESQYKTMLMLCEIKQSLRSKPKEEMAEVIIQSYGVEESIAEISDIMEKLPRKDEAIQSRLKPFVDTLKARRKKGFKRNKHVSDSECSDEEQDSDSGETRGRQPGQQTGVQPWRETIEHLMDSGDLGPKLVSVKVLQKSGLRTYTTKQRETKYFFNLGVADETGSCKVMVYGRERYQVFKVDVCYGLRQVIIEDNVLKVTKRSIVSKMNPFSVPEELQLQAQMIIYPQAPLCSIAKAKVYADMTRVSVAGTIMEVGVVERVKMKTKRRKKERLQFRLTDETDSIWITLWGDSTQLLTGTSHGDSVQVTNVNTNHYNNTVSLSSTSFTRIFKVQRAAVQSVTMEIIGIISTGKIQTELESVINKVVSTYTVESSKLAKVFGIKLEGDFEERLLDKLPLKAEAEITGSQINNIRAAKEM